MHVHLSVDEARKKLELDEHEAQKKLVAKYITMHAAIAVCLAAIRTASAFLLAFDSSVVVSFIFFAPDFVYRIDVSTNSVVGSFVRLEEKVVCIVKPNVSNSDTDEYLFVCGL